MKESGSKEKILRYCECFCHDYAKTKEDSTSRSKELENIYDTVLEAMDKVCNIAKGFVALLGPWPGAYDSSANHASELFSYKGTKAEQMLLKDTLQNSGQWKAIWKELLTKGTASMAAVDEVKTLCAELQASEVSADVLSRGIACHQKWKTTLLSQMVEEVQKHLSDAVIERATQVLNTLDSSSKDQELPSFMTKSFLDSLLAGLQHFAHIPAALQLTGKLQKAQVKFSKALAFEELKALSDRFPRQRQEKEEFLASLPSVQDFEKAMQQCPDIIKQNAAGGEMEHVIFWLWRRMMIKFEEKHVV